MTQPADTPLAPSRLTAAQLAAFTLPALRVEWTNANHYATTATDDAARSLWAEYALRVATAATSHAGRFPDGWMADATLAPAPLPESPSSAATGRTDRKGDLLLQHDHAVIDRRVADLFLVEFAGGVRPPVACG